MKPTERLRLTDRIAVELQSRYTLNDMIVYFGAVGVSVRNEVRSAGFSKVPFAKTVLAEVPLAKVLEIAADLGITAPISVVANDVPANWKGTDFLRLFISHVSTEKLKATRLKECLWRYGVSGFVAHEDIHPTLEWQIEIERALSHMDAFVSIHTPGFSSSFWTQQEIGFAFSRGVLIVPFKMGENPTGFISKWQALPRRNRTAEEIAAEIDAILDKDRRTSERLRAAKVALLSA